MTADLEVLTWNLAFGFQFSYEWNGWTQTLESPWLNVAGSYQRALGPLYAGRELTVYEEPSPGVTVSGFGDSTVVANRTAAAYEVDGHRVAPGGFLARGPGVVAGVFSGAFAGVPLSAGLHFLIVERRSDSLVVQQPLGEDTLLGVEAPSVAPRAVAYAADGRPLGEVGGRLEGRRFLFEYLGTVAGARAAFYRIS